jgi:hypothetical protein
VPCSGYGWVSVWTAAAPPWVDHLRSGTEQSDKSIDTVGSYLRRIRAARAYVLDIDPVRVDYHPFTGLAALARRDDDPVALQAALALWRGPALADVSGYWADRRRHTLQAERLAAYDELLTAYLRVLPASQPSKGGGRSSTNNSSIWRISTVRSALRPRARNAGNISL